MRLPLFFWHIPSLKDAEHMSVRRSGPSWDGTLETIDTVQYKNENIAPITSIELMGELSNQHDLNIVGQTIRRANEFLYVCDELNQLVELSELIIHEGETVHIRSIEKYWPQYSALRVEARKIQETIFQRYGKRAPVYRVPLSYAFKLKKPFVKQRVAHLKRILNNDSYRREQLGTD